MAKRTRVEAKLQLLSDMQAAMARLGAEIAAPVYGDCEEPGYRLELPRGELNVGSRIRGDCKDQLPAIYCRFSDPKYGAKFVDCNPHSGKWHHYARFWGDVQRGFFLRMFVSTLENMLATMRELRQLVESSSDKVQSVSSAIAAFEAIQAKYRDLGTQTAEHQHVFQHMLYRAFLGYDVYPNRDGASWQLFEDPRRAKAARELSKQATLVIDALQQARAEHYQELRGLLAEYCWRV